MEDRFFFYHYVQPRGHRPTKVHVGIEWLGHICSQREPGNTEGKSRVDFQENPCKHCVARLLKMQKELGEIIK